MGRQDKSIGNPLDPPLFWLVNIFKGKIIGGGGCEWYQPYRHDFAYNRLCFLDTLKGILSSFNPVSALSAKKGVVCFEGA